MSERPEGAEEPRRPTPARAGRGDRPTPVRVGVPGDPTDHPDAPTPFREFVDLDGTPWRVEVGGRSRTGLRGEPHAPLLLLIFKPGSPAPDGGEQPPLEVLAVARTLDALTDHHLDGLLAQARPLRPPSEAGRPAREPARSARRRSRD